MESTEITPPPPSQDIENHIDSAADDGMTYVNPEVLDSDYLDFNLYDYVMANLKQHGSNHIPMVSYRKIQYLYISNHQNHELPLR